MVWFQKASPRRWHENRNLGGQSSHWDTVALTKLLQSLSLLETNTTVGLTALLRTTLIFLVCKQPLNLKGTHPYSCHFSLLSSNYCIEPSPCSCFFFPGTSFKFYSPSFSLLFQNHFDLFVLFLSKCSVALFCRTCTFSAKLSSPCPLRLSQNSWKCWAH